MRDLFDLTGKKAVVTGASSGLGATAALAYAEYGADVALLARRTEKLESVKTEIEKTGRRAFAIACDVTNEESVASAMIEAHDLLSGIDILLNNAGVATLGSVDTLTEEDWDKTFDVNVKGIFLASKFALPYMVEQQYGKIINISSVNAVMADKDDMFARHAYNSSKSAVIGLTKGMACTYAKHGITVNSIGPALFETEMTAEGLFGNEDFMQFYSAHNPTGRAARKDELNGTVIYLSSDASSYVQGQYILVDGGDSQV